MKYTSWNELNLDERSMFKHDVIKWLVSQRLSNYGYDRTDWIKLTKRASYLRNKVKSNADIPLNKSYGILNRLMLNDFGAVNYHTGQSFNEEYITLLEIFTEKGE